MKIIILAATTAAILAVLSLAFIELMAKTMMYISGVVMLINYKMFNND